MMNKAESSFSCETARIWSDDKHFVHTKNVGAGKATKNQVDQVVVSKIITSKGKITKTI
jgi:hypothetical protein